MSATTALLRGRAKAQSLMTDAVTVTRLVPNAANTTTDPETGVVTDSYTTIYTGPAKVQSQQTVTRPTEVGDAARWLVHREVHLPVTARVATDDIVTVTACVLDPDVVGRVFHIRDMVDKSYATARRCSVVEDTS